MTQKRNLPDPDIYLAKKERYDRLRAAVQKLSVLKFRKRLMNRWLVNLIPAIKRTDNDLGSLPINSKEYTAQKPNKDHALLCLLCKLVQVYWKIRDGGIAISSIECDEFDSQLKRLETIVATGYDNYVIAGKLPYYMLLTEAEIADDQEKTRLAEIEEVRQDKLQDDLEQEQRDADERKRLDEELGLDIGDDHADMSGEVQKEHDRINAVNQQRREPQPESDQLSVEAADKCLGDCDTCGAEQHARCDGALSEEIEVVLESDVEDLEQTVEDAIPPIPDDDESPVAGNEAADNSTSTNDGVTDMT